VTTPYVGEIYMVGFNFAPEGWLQCNGQLVSISDYNTLYNLIGTTYGGDGQSTFAVPNLQSRVPVGTGQGAGLSPYSLGEAGGVEYVTLSTAQMPAHSHTLLATSAAATAATPATGMLLATPSGDTLYSAGAGVKTALVPSMVTSVGSNQPHSNIQPSLGIFFIIAFEGLYPSPG
jgi:microcystin-dependent protein